MATPLILRLDISGIPLRWIPWQEAVCLYTRGLVGWTTGDHAFTFFGGTTRLTGARSQITIHSIVATRSSTKNPRASRTRPPLSNQELFRRDGNLCLYCGQEFSDVQLTRDHIVPLSQGGKDIWVNVVSACRVCNTRKGGRNPEQASMPLLAVPYEPNWAEFLALSNRRILADQMHFLKAQFNLANPRQQRTSSGYE